nr:E3 ubiquitin-protein ligase Topors-like [Ziziphus jujuba var. spinosa]
MESSSSRRRRSREKLVGKVIWPSVHGQTCPICLENLDLRSSAVLSDCKHAYCLGCIGKWSRLRRKCPLCNADFKSWFSHISLSSWSFHKQHLTPLIDTSRKKPRFEEEHPPQRSVINGVHSRTRPLPWRRSFGRPGSVIDGVLAARKLRWRASIYEKRLQAVPLSPRNHHEQNIIGNNGVKERTLRRIEPWIRRELQAILGDTDPSNIVHVAASVYISFLELKVHAASARLDMGDNFLAPLQPFLLDRTNMFWHELRCFAESSFTMETYDAVVEYRHLG